MRKFCRWCRLEKHHSEFRAGSPKCFTCDAKAVKAAVAGQAFIRELETKPRPQLRAPKTDLGGVDIDRIYVERGLMTHAELAAARTSTRRRYGEAD